MGLADWIRDPNFQWVLAGSVLLGMGSGALGTFALLRKRSLMGDVLSHAALPGICIAFMLTSSKSLGPLLLGAAATGLLASFTVSGITRYSRIKADTALGLVLTVFFGFGILLLTEIAQSGVAAQAGLDKFLFGQAASLVAEDVKVIAGVSAVLFLSLIIFFHEFKLISFDMAFGKGIGRPVEHIDNFLMLLIVAAVVIGLQAVGVVLMSAMLITPAIAARYWTDRLPVMVVLSALFGGFSGMLGTLVSTMGARLPTGPLIVLAATAVFGLSLLFAPRRGLVARILRHLRLRQRVQREHILRALFEWQEVVPEEVAAAGATLADIALQRRGAFKRLAQGLRRLMRAGLVEVASGGPPERYRLTAQGLQEAYRVVRSHRLWEMFLMHEAELAVEHVDRDADVLEHHLPPAVVAQLEELLRLHQREPKLPASVHPLASEPAEAQGQRS